MVSKARYSTKNITGLTLKPVRTPAFFITLNYFRIKAIMRKKATFHLLVSLISILLTFVFGWLIKNWQTEAVIQHVKLAEIFVDRYLLLIELGMVIVTLTIIEVLVRLLEDYRKASMATASGLFFFRPNSTERQIRKSENFLRDESVGCGFLYVRGATGWETFSSSESPLYQATKSCRDVRIILIYPLSEAVIQRSHDLKMNVNKYREQIYESIEFLRSLKRGSGRPESLMLKMYQGYPFWKYIILDNYVWVQQYPVGDHVRNSPSYAYERVPRFNKGVFDHLVNQFLRYWSSHHLGVYNFDNDEVKFFDSQGHLIESKPIR